MPAKKSAATEGELTFAFTDVEAPDMTDSRPRRVNPFTTAVAELDKTFSDETGRSDRAREFDANKSDMGRLRRMLSEAGRACEVPKSVRVRVLSDDGKRVRLRFWLVTKIARVRD